MAEAFYIRDFRVAHSQSQIANRKLQIRKPSAAALQPHHLSPSTRFTFPDLQDLAKIYCGSGKCQLTGGCGVA